jgi:NADH-quinone oxidoreductase subunit H
MAGWGANSALSLIAGYRFVAQGLAYELPLMFALISAAAGAQSLNVAVIAAAQSHLWYAVWMPAAFVVYLASVYAFSFLGPFGYPAGADLVGGVLAELSGLLTWGRRRLPVLRADRYAELAWMVLLPLSVCQALVPALADLTR